MSLKKQTFDGLKWQVGATVFQKVIGFGTAIILARYLGPSVFGLFALTLTLMGSFELFKSMGIDSALLRRQDDFNRAANTAFLIIPVLGILLYIILNFSAPTVGKYINNFEVVPVLRVLGISFVISCFAKVPGVVLERNMQFREIAIADFTSSTLFSLSALVFVFLHLGIWALIYAYILKIFTYMLMVCLYARWKPQLEFDKKIALEMFNFGKFIFLASLVWFLKMNLDNLLVGKLLGVAALGLYAVAFNIGNFSADYFGSKVYRVTYPAYSKLQSNLDDLRAACLKVFKHVSLVAIPFGVGILLLGSEFLRLAYGEKWIGAASVLKILAWAGIFNTLPASMGGIFLACGKPKLGFYTNALQVIIFLIFITPMAKIFGLNGVGAIVSISALVAFIMTLNWVMKILAINLKVIYSALKPSLIASVFMTLGIISIKYILLQNKVGIPFYCNFIILFLFALGIYALSLFTIDRTIFKNIKEFTAQ